MEHTQMVLFQVPGEKAAEIARYEGLLAEMEGHKARLQLMPGFLDMVMTRSLNDTGPVQLVVLTRWRDPDSLGDYEERADYSRRWLLQELVVPGSIQIYDMEVII
jgi:heme-degrading monooxygenase HmoA